MILDLLLFHFLNIVVAEAQTLESIDRIIDDERGLERYGRWPRSRPYEDRPPGCDQKYHTESTPYVAVILSKTSGNFLCMGSILGPNYVLTVRECLMRDDMDDLLVMGGYMSAWWGRHAQVKRVAEVVKSDEDLAILKLKKRFRFTRAVRPIKLSNRPLKMLTKTYGIHYGMVGFVRAPWDAPGEPLPKTAYYELKFGTLMDGKPNVDKCKQAYSDIVFNETTMFCTFENTSFCWGNLGSPSVVLMDEQLVQMGIVVRAFCDDKSLPNLHLRIDAYQGWIRSNSEAKRQKS